MSPIVFFCTEKRTIKKTGPALLWIKIITVKSSYSFDTVQYNMGKLTYTQRLNLVGGIYVLRMYLCVDLS